MRRNLNASSRKRLQGVHYLPRPNAQSQRSMQTCAEPESFLLRFTMHLRREGEGLLEPRERQRLRTRNIDRPSLASMSLISALSSRGPRVLR